MSKQQNYCVKFRCILNFQSPYLKVIKKSKKANSFSVLTEILNKSVN